MAVTQSPIYEEVFSFLVSSPTLEQIISFRPSETTQARVSYLLEVNRQGDLSREEHAELDEFEQVEHFVRMLKAHAHQLLDQQ